MKRLALNILAVAALSSSAANAFAAADELAQPRMEARLKAPVEKPVKVIVDGRVWSCDAALCTSNGEGLSQALSRECRRVTRKLGPLAGYRHEQVTLDAAQLNACNGEGPNG